MITYQSHITKSISTSCPPHALPPSVTLPIRTTHHDPQVHPLQLQPTDKLPIFISTIDHLRQLHRLLGKQQSIIDLFINTTRNISILINPSSQFPAVSAMLSLVKLRILAALFPTFPFYHHSSHYHNLNPNKFNRNTTYYCQHLIRHMISV